jgi:hypothetical protein
VTNSNIPSKTNAWKREKKLSRGFRSAMIMMRLKFVIFPLIRHAFGVPPSPVPFGGFVASLLVGKAFRFGKFLLSFISETEVI